MEQIPDYCNSFGPPFPPLTPALHSWKDQSVGAEPLEGKGSRQGGTHVSPLESQVPSGKGRTKFREQSLKQQGTGSQRPQDVAHT